MTHRRGTRPRPLRPPSPQPAPGRPARPARAAPPRPSAAPRGRRAARPPRRRAPSPRRRRSGRPGSDPSASTSARTSVTRPGPKTTRPGSDSYVKGFMPPSAPPARPAPRRSAARWPRSPRRPQRPARGLSGLLGGTAGVHVGQDELARHRVGPEDAQVGDHDRGPAPLRPSRSAIAGVAAEAHRGHEVAALDEGSRVLAHDDDHLAGRRRDLRRAAGTGQARRRDGRSRRSRSS